ncbi:MAG: hypothetical protein CVU11_12400 [Bacteroidetes bacterium HGW-Bacteroidetes-6]|jgi:hypothetical protein|nr:MAG: hypothetical protein CVU11_12400 [Bacteroidetes bacterium HGW-Bacteroidetes-6]
MKTLLSLLIITSIATQAFSQDPDTLKPFFLENTDFDPDYSIYDTYGNYQSNGLYTLPCELLQFTAGTSNKGFVFNWATITETNTSNFSVDYLNPKGIWEHIETVEASGNSNCIVEYNLTSNKMFPTGTIFRLVLTDNDGTSRSLAMISANVNNPDRFNPISNFRVSSNRNSINLLWDCSSENIETSIKVYSISGQLLFSQDNNSNDGFNYIENIELMDGNVFIAVAESAYGRTSIKFGL